MTMTKDDAIVTQVAAKIAADLVGGRVGGSLDEVLSDFSTAFEYVKDDLFRSIGVNAINAAFPGTVEVATVASAEFSPLAAVEAAQKALAQTLRIAGKQHGPLPDWLLKDAAAAGVTEVWDNRDKLSENPKRPHFKAVNGDKAFWPPKAR